MLYRHDQTHQPLPHKRLVVPCGSAGLRVSSWGCCVCRAVSVLLRGEGRWWLVARVLCYAIAVFVLAEAGRGLVSTVPLTNAAYKMGRCGCLATAPEAGSVPCDLLP